MFNLIEKLSDFLDVSKGKFLVERTHICLYTSILIISEQQKSGNTIEVSRKKLMHLSQIKSNATYHKCITELVSNKYISYVPSYHPIHGSQIVIL